MLEIFKNPLSVSILIYIVIIFILYVTKPSLCFDKNNNIKTFGCSRENNTLFTIYILSLIIAIIFYFFLNLKLNSQVKIQIMGN